MTSHSKMDCPECGGSGGWALGLDPIECNTCKGYGQVEESADDPLWMTGLLALLAVGMFFFVLHLTARFASYLT